MDGSAGGTFATGDGPNAFSDLGVVAVATPAGGVFVGDATGRVFAVGPPVSGTLQLTLTYDRPAGANGPAELAAITGPGGVSRLLIGRRLADSNGLINNGRVELFEGGLSLLTIEGSQFAAQVGTRVAATRDVDGDGVDEILFVEYGGSPLQPDPVTIVRQDGTVVDSFLVDAASTGRPFAIADTTGDGRGEWGIGLFNGGFGLAECRLHARGLAEPVLSQPGGASRVDYSFDLSPLRAGAVYWQLYSLSGSSPGMVLDPAWPRLPLQLDPFTNLFFVQSNTATFPGAIGNLDGAGRGTSSLVFAPALAVLASGWEVSSCVVAFGAGGWPPVAVSNPRLVVLP
ncbi:MAG: hypothetical protein NXI31_01420 [bacterium]|nr:hypothetical protein [bacterium]